LEVDWTFLSSRDEIFLKDFVLITWLLTDLEINMAVPFLCYLASGHFGRLLMHFEVMLIFTSVS
jgi:hypothetical protein